MGTRGAAALWACVALAASGGAAAEGRFSGYAAFEPRFFFSSPQWPDQDDSTVSPSVILQPEYRYSWNNNDDRLAAIAFLHYDADDDNRTHADVRELSWTHRGSSWDVVLGVSKVFWGVAESRHLVDTVNQTDLVEDFDEEDKLGQPMANLNVTTDWGTFGVFVLPYFRERTFPDAEARLRGAIPVAVDDPVFESGAKRWHVDFAGRWQKSIGDLDFGIAHFHGTGREPRLEAGFSRGRAMLIPHYDQIDQTSLDAQYTFESWLWKLEAMTRRGQGDRFAAAVAGFEYTIGGLAGTAIDLGLLAEYLYDGRDATAPPTPNDDDVFVGMRFSFNDVASTAMLAGAIVDPDTRATQVSVEFERRLFEDWKIELELRALFNVSVNDPALGGFRRDDHLLARLSRFF